MNVAPERPQWPADGCVIDQQQAGATGQQCFDCRNVAGGWHPRVRRIIVGQADARDTAHVVKKHHVIAVRIWRRQNGLGRRLLNQCCGDSAHLGEHAKERIVVVVVPFGDDQNVDRIHADLLQARRTAGITSCR